jgi:hypothetical protein
MFSDSEKIHYDGTDILIANRMANEVIKLSTSDDSVSTIIGPDATNLANVLDVTDDGENYYTLARTSNLYNYATNVCKWSMADTSSPTACHSSTGGGIALTYYDGDTSTVGDGDVIVLQGGDTRTAYRKAIILDADDMSLTTRTIPYYSGVGAYNYASNLDVDDSNGDVYIVYREFDGRVRQYERTGDVDGTYCASTACYTNVMTAARYSSSVFVEDGYVYTNGYYWSAYYGGMKRYAAGSTGGITTLWSQFNDVGYKGSAAVTSGGDFYVNSNYAYRYYSFSNFDD